MTVRRKKIRRRKGPKRHLRKSIAVTLVVIAAVLIAAVGFIKIPVMINNSKLRKLGYDETAIKMIDEKKLTSVILKNDYYSDYLAQCITDGSVRSEYLSLYTLVDQDRGLTDNDFLLYNRLLDLGYETDQLDDLYSNLYYWEITPLLIFDYQWDETEYIKDCKDCRSSNSPTAFTLKGDYLTEYKNTTTTYDVADEVLVNKRYCLDASYAPTDLTDITTEYAASGMQLRKVAADAFLNMAKASLQNGTPFFASSTYISYEDQASYYKSISSQLGSSLADIYSERAGYSDHQTGMAVNISATYEDNENITSTKVYEWLQKNCANYGFILRYPDAKKDITDKESEPTHLLYVGKDLAKKINDSNLTYDEYYLLYLSTWYDANEVPASDIIESTGCNDQVQAQKTEASPTPSASASAS